jgi:predicted ester cyclase
MPDETARTLYQRFLNELWRDGAQLDEVAGQLATPGFVVHQARVDGTASEARRGPAALAGMVGESLALFSDVSVTVDAGPVVEDDKVAARWTFHGTYEGGIPGATAPPGTQVAFSGIDLFRVEDGRFAEYWVSSDGAHLMAQLGVGG